MHQEVDHDNDASPLASRNELGDHLWCDLYGSMVSCDIGVHGLNGTGQCKSDAVYYIGLADTAMTITSQYASSTMRNKVKKFDNKLRN